MVVLVLNDRLVIMGKKIKNLYSLLISCISPISQSILSNFDKYKSDQSGRKATVSIKHLEHLQQTLLFTSVGSVGVLLSVTSCPSQWTPSHVKRECASGQGMRLDLSMQAPSCAMAWSKMAQAQYRRSVRQMLCKAPFGIGSTIAKIFLSVL